MITGFSVSNFKSLVQIPEEKDQLLPFGSLNVLIGPNESGKSSLLQAIDFLRAFFRTSIEVYLQDRGWKPSDLPNVHLPGKPIRWTIQVDMDDEGDGIPKGRYNYSVSLRLRRSISVKRERLTWCSDSHSSEAPQVLVDRRRDKCQVYDQIQKKLVTTENFGLPASLMSILHDRQRGKRHQLAIRFRDWVERFRAFLIWDPKLLRSPSRGSHDEIGQSGEHLASVLRQLKSRRPEAFKRLLRRIRLLFPNLVDISVSGRKWGWETLQLHESNGLDAVFNSRQISDGILRLLAVTSLLYLDKIPTVITFEEPENGVHPQLLREVVQILRELTQRKPPNRCQVFLTTHSPYVLDEFLDFPEQVFCVDRTGPQNGSRVFRLKDSKQLNVVRKAFDKSLGEAWVSGLIGGIPRRVGE
jgi:predicted ATPase